MSSISQYHGKAIKFSGKPLKLLFFFLNDTPPTELSPLPHPAPLPIAGTLRVPKADRGEKYRGGAGIEESSGGGDRVPPLRAAARSQHRASATIYRALPLGRRAPPRRDRPGARDAPELHTAR